MPPVEHPMLAGLRRVRANVTAPTEGNAWSMSDPDLAAALDESPAVLAAGRVNPEQAPGHHGTMAGLPPVEAAVRGRAEKFLIGQAAILDPLLLAKAGRALTETLTAISHADERWTRQHERRHLHLLPAGDGMVALLDAEAAAILSAAFDPLAAPRPACDGTPDPRTAGQRRAAGLLPGGDVLSAAVARRVGRDARIRILPSSSGAHRTAGRRPDRPGQPGESLMRSPGTISDRESRGVAVQRRA
jgi:hypothetical protein